jgi:hypothetical protein
MASKGNPVSPHARQDPPWTVCGDPRHADFGCVFANRVASDAVALSFDRDGRQHALTLFAGAELSAEIVIYGRRFSVIRLTADAL